ncbi:uncharacterized protein LOC136088721 [Hydra vulgaris]|uniref:Uncharacterized protein LOC136088721 n=1 Tax=Hydra vulgaris TaxID=6087 RepID=A0ABM4D4T0_HYDVU
MAWRKEVENLQPTTKSKLSQIIGESKNEINIKSLNLEQFNSLSIHHLDSEDLIDFDIAKVDRKLVIFLIKFWSCIGVNFGDKLPTTNFHTVIILLDIKQLIHFFRLKLCSFAQHNVST